MLVLPGGGFHFLSVDLEGWSIARWLADRGVAAFVLQYRVEPTPVDDEFRRFIVERFRPEDWIGGVPPYLHDAVEKARGDAQAALRLIRTDAERWHVDPTRIGMSGFSAGAITTVATAVANAPGARPDFVASLYGTMLPVVPPIKPPPLFAAVASDDVAFSKQGFGLIESWQRASSLRV